MRRYIWLFYEWLESGEYWNRQSSLIHTEFIVRLEDVIRNGEWVEIPLQQQLEEEISKVKAELYKKNKSIKVMDIYRLMQEKQRTIGEIEDNSLSYSTVYLAHKLQKEKTKQSSALFL